MILTVYDIFTDAIVISKLYDSFFEQFVKLVLCDILTTIS